MKKPKRLRIVLAINSLASAPYEIYNNHMLLTYSLGRRFPNIDFMLHNPSRVSIDRMRNSAATIAKNHDFDYVWFLDDDVIIHQMVLEALLNCKADIAAADVLIRSYPFDHMCFRWTNKQQNAMRAIKRFPKNAGVYPVDAVGFSCCLIHRSVLEKTPEPYFITGLNNTEDVYFCIKARDADPTLKIVVETRAVCSHILWPEVINAVNKKNYTKYYRSQFPHLCKREETVFPVSRCAPGTNYEDVVRSDMGATRA